MRTGLFRKGEMEYWSCGVGTSAPRHPITPSFHEPHPLIPSFSPSGGEGAQLVRRSLGEGGRAVEGDSDRFMASIRVRILEVFPPHEPFIRSSRRKEAQASWAQGDQSLLTSAATVQGLNAGRFAWGNSLPEGEGKRGVAHREADESRNCPTSRALRESRGFPRIIVNPFEQTLAQHGLRLRRGKLQTLQLNIGRKCNQACRHCHVDAAPWRTEMIDETTAQRIGDWIRRYRPSIVDITGGAPELSEFFRYFVEISRGAGAE